MQINTVKLEHYERISRVVPFYQPKERIVLLFHNSSEFDVT